MKTITPLALAGAFAILVSGCATLPAPVRTYLKAESDRVKQKPTAAVVTTCMIRDELGEAIDDDFILRESTERLAAEFSAALGTQLAEGGVTLTKTVVPALCLATFKPEVTTYGMAENSDAKPASVTLPLRPDERFSADPALAAAYTRLLVALQDLRKGSGFQPANRRPLAMDEAQVALLASEIGVKDLWVLQAAGGQVSGGKTVGAAVLTSVLTLGISGGSMIGMSTAVDGLGYTIALVDLEHREVVWMKVVLPQNIDPEFPQAIEDTRISALVDQMFSPANESVPKPPAPRHDARR
jgi:hypothetical protein